MIGRALLLVAICAPSPHVDDPRPAQTIVREFYAAQGPAFSSGNDEESIAKFEAAIHAVALRKATLALELHQGYPDHVKIPEFMGLRWNAMSNVLELADKADVEAGIFLGDEVRADLRRTAFQARARARLVSPNFSVKQKLAAINLAIERDPENELGGVHLLDFVEQYGGSPEELQRIADLILRKWPDGRWAAVGARKLKRQLDRLGETIELAGAEAVSGSPFDLASLKGKPTVLMIFDGDFTYSGDELKALLALRSKHREDVHFAGLLCLKWRSESPLGEYLPANGVDFPWCTSPAPHHGRDPGASPARRSSGSWTQTVAWKPWRTAQHTLRRSWQRKKTTDRAGR